MKRGLSPLASLYGGLVELKNRLYDKDYIVPLQLPVPVVSVGNLTVGGTGKTPFTHYCLQYFKKHGLKVSVVSRNYKAQVDDIAKVNLEVPEAAAYFGDEPTLLAQKNPQATFYVGPKKFRTAQFAFNREQPDLVLIDDGFQHRQLDRDLDFVILDATELVQNYQCVPAGRAREPWESLQRATAFLISKANLASDEQLQELQQKLKKFAKPIFVFNYATEKAFYNGQAKDLKEFPEAYLVSGIAKPQVFEKNIQDEGVKVVGHKIYGDHHPYKAQDVNEIVGMARSLSVPVITTEKDAVKLTTMWPKDVPLWVAPLQISIQKNEDELHELLNQVLR